MSLEAGRDISFEGSPASFHFSSFLVLSPLFTNFLTKTKEKRPVNENTGNHFQFLISVAEKIDCLVKMNTLDIPAMTLLQLIGSLINEKSYC